jgi:c-di-GMP-related signal transduction protein
MEFQMPAQSVEAPLEDKTGPQSSRHFVARQPILKADENVFGYELLFRDGIENHFGGSDSDNASRSVLDSSLLMGLDMLCDGRQAFINCTRDVLLNDYITLMPPRQTVAEILESIAPDDSVVAACRNLKEAGYLIALDDFTHNDSRGALAGLADIIKVDFRLTPPSELAGIVDRYGKRCQMLAEKVETQQEFRVAKQLGFVFFQGYFFCRPEMVPTSRLSPNRMNHLRMLQAASRPELDLREVEHLVKGEPSICYRLLRYLNSSLFGFSGEVRSVRHGLTLLGERETRRWLHLVATLAAGQNKTSALVLAALVRARFCELLGRRIGRSDSDLFLLGLLSLMDAILDMPMTEIMKSISVNPECKAALLEQIGPSAGVYQLVLAQEAADWPRVAELAQQLPISEDEIADDHWQAMEWARQMTGL